MKLKVFSFAFHPMPLAVISAVTSQRRCAKIMFCGNVFMNENQNNEKTNKNSLTSVADCHRERQRETTGIQLQCAPKSIHRTTDVLLCAPTCLSLCACLRACLYDCAYMFHFTSIATKSKMACGIQVL